MRAGRHNLQPSRTRIVMRQAATTSSMTLFLAIAVCTITNATAGGPDSAAGTIAQARRLIAAKDHAAATVLLEDALLEADNKHKPAIVDLLRETYESLAQKAQAEGRAQEAAHYRDNLAIIVESRAAVSKKRPTDETPKSKELPDRQPIKRGDFKKTANVLPALQPSEPTAPEAAPKSRPSPAFELPALPEPAQVVAPKSKSKSALKAELAQPPAAPASPADSALVRRAGTAAPAAPALADADQFFTDQRYDEALRIYTALARQNRLPADRVKHWVYCRCVEVARRIKLHPQSPREWDELEAEVVNIQQLAPKLWLGEYLRDKVAEARRDRGRSPNKSDAVVIRGSAPEEAVSQPRRFPRLFGGSKPRSDSATAQQPLAATTDTASGEVPLVLAAAPPRNAPSALPDADPAVAGAGAATDRIGNWQIYETPNFRIFHRDSRLAEQAGEVAEVARSTQARRWGSRSANRPWSPRCELYLYPTGKVLAHETGQPEDSPGFSTMQSDGQRIVARRTNLRADHAQLLTAILPHEVTHVVLADLFTFQQIPRWADEGMAVLAEPRTEQERRVAELDEPLRSGRVFDVGKLMAMDYPRPDDWPLYYAQSVSLTMFLVEQGTPEQFVQFVRDMHAKGTEPALRAAYRISGFAELHERWLEHAKTHSSSTNQVRLDAGAQPSPAAER
jgi:hypothetical protein